MGTSRSNREFIQLEALAIPIGFHKENLIFSKSGSQSKKRSNFPVVQGIHPI